MSRALAHPAALRIVLAIVYVAVVAMTARTPVTIALGAFVLVTIALRLHLIRLSPRRGA